MVKHSVNDILYDLNIPHLFYSTNDNLFFNENLHFIQEKKIHNDYMKMLLLSNAIARDVSHNVLFEFENNYL